MTRREIAPGIHWLGGCGDRQQPDGEILHIAASTYLMVGTERTLLFDTGAPGHWAVVERALDEILGVRPLDFVVPSHPELPHAGNLPRLFAKYPELRARGDTRDYHLFYPLHTVRFEKWPKHRPIALGGGLEFIAIEAPIKDLTSTVWGYEAREQVMFVADAFGYMHYGDDDGDPLHRPGECRMLSSELPSLPDANQAAYTTKGALAWTGYMDASQFVNAVQGMLAKHPAKFIAPAHGNVISDLGAIMPIMQDAYGRVYRGDRARLTER